MPDGPRFFVELGANDGISLSNTYALEKVFGWDGICIEPVPEKIDALTKNRSCVCVSSLVDECDGLECDFVIRSFDTLLYGDLLSYCPDLGVTPGGLPLQSTDRIVRLKTKSLTSILDENDAPPLIDFLSLDTEGSEYRILKGVDFSKYNFKLICVEYNQHRQEIKELLENKGYGYYKETQCDDFYIFGNK